LGGWGSRGLLSGWGGFASQHGTGVLQLGDLAIDLCQDF
jgi:hypothetical protein